MFKVKLDWEKVTINGKEIFLYRAVVYKAYYVENSHNPHPLWHAHHQSRLLQDEGAARVEVEYLTGLYCPPASDYVP